MHEHGLCEPVLDRVRQCLPADWSGGRLVVRLRVSELSGLSEPALQAAFDHAHECHAGPQIEVELRAEGLLGRCPRCGQVVEVTPELACAVCGTTGLPLAAGEALLIEEITVIPDAGPTSRPSETAAGEADERLSAAHEH